jgi:cytidylate kinase
MKTAIKTTLRCGDTLHVLVASCDAELQRLIDATTKKVLRANGHAVESADGSAVWIIDEQVFPAVWSDDGNRVRANRVRCTRDGSGKIKKTTLRQVWVAP